MPNFVLQKVGDALNDVGLPIKGSRILLLGVSYKADVADMRESPSLEVFKRLAARGGDVRYCDPHFPALDLDGEPYTSARVDRRGGPRRGLRGDAHPAPRVPRDAALGSGEAGRRHAQRRAGRPRTSTRCRAVILVLGAGYIGAAVAELALARGRAGRAGRQLARHLARQLDPLERRGARVETADIRDARGARRAAGARARDRVVMLAAQASRPISEREPDYTEQTNLTGARRVAEAVAASAAARARPRQLAARLRRRAERRGRPGRALRRAGRPRAHVQGLRRAGARHARPPRRLRARERAPGDRLRPEPGRARRARLGDGGRQVPPAGGRRAPSCTLDGGGTATIGAVHVADAARLLLDCPVPEPGGVAHANVAAETLTVADVAALAEGREPAGGAAWTRRAQLRVRARRGGVPGAMRFLVTGVTGFLGWRTATLLAERGHEVAGLARPGGAGRAHAAGDPRRSASTPATRPRAALVAGHDVVLHFAGVPDPARARAGPGPRGARERRHDRQPARRLPRARRAR